MSIIDPIIEQIDFPLELDDSVLKKIQSILPGREVTPNLKGERKYRKRWNRYIQFATSYYNSNKHIHYEVCHNGHIELHFEGDFDTKFADLAQYLCVNTQDKDRIQWSYRGDYNLGTCQYTRLITKLSDLDKVVDEFVKPMDKLIDKYKTQDGACLDDSDYDASSIQWLKDCQDMDEVCLVDNMSLIDLLHLNITIPEYQRIYSWEEKNVKRLLEDVSNIGGTYRMGAIILHHNDDKFAIIDGQQRLVTLSLLLRRLGYSKSPLLKFCFNSSEAEQYVAYNRFLIDNYVTSHIPVGRQDLARKLLRQLEFSVLIINTDHIDLAYTFFSNENSRGKSLSDFDLLKAHHLRYIKEEKQAEHLAKQWDGMLSKANEKYEDNMDKPYYRSLGLYVFRLRQWMLNRKWDDFAPYKIKNEYEAAPTLEDIPSFGERFDFNESIQGGTHFFAFVKQFEYRYELFASTDEFKAIHKLDDRTHWWFRDVIETFLFAYFLKFGTEYLSEVLIGISRIVMQYRFDMSRANYESLLHRACDSGLIYTIDRATSPTFVLADLVSRIKELPIIHTDISHIARDFQAKLRSHLCDIKRNKVVIDDFKKFI